MPREILKSQEALKNLDSEIEKYINTPEPKLKYKQLRDIVLDLRLFINTFSRWSIQHLFQN